MFGLGGQELLIVLVIVLVLFGGKKIPELLRGVGKGVGELQKGLHEGRNVIEKSYQEELHAKENEAERAKPADTADTSNQPG
ncbi:MAG: twin-arginine translocase TatA/TatE family subunit [Fimbriimonadaceae bacterium]|nr:twin-arginine translocase TatA/TatE family subunit [Chthonomonadaceae bacterium]MCO5295387.1 twin-arginine translocase TatA/TatE family subunit [Fimbriimonadaceae bacterium]